MEVFRRAGLALLAAGALVACRHVAPAPIDPAARATAFEARRLDAPELRPVVERALGTPLASWPPARWDARLLAAAALALQPSVAAARARSDAAGAAITTAGARPNPTLTLTPERVSNPAAAISPWIAALSIDWPIETAGKRARRVERARALAESAEHAIESETWSTRSRIATALLAVVAGRQRVVSLEREASAARTLAALLDQRVAQGTASATDVAPFRMASLESDVALTAEATLAGERLAVLAQAIGVPVSAIAALELVADDDASLATASREDLLRETLLRRADVRTALADYAAAEAALRLELAKQWPDLHLGPGYQFDQGENKWSVGLSLELPVLDRNGGPIAEAVAARAAAAVAFDAAQAQVVAEVEQALARRDGAARERERLAALATDRRRNLDRTRAALALGAADRASALGAELEWLRAERARGDAESTWRQALVDLEAAVQPASQRLALEADAGGTP